jgi:hypothetical protein
MRTDWLTDGQTDRETYEEANSRFSKFCEFAWNSVGEVSVRGKTVVYLKIIIEQKMYLHFVDN